MSPVIAHFELVHQPYWRCRQCVRVHFPLYYSKSFTSVEKVKQSEKLLLIDTSINLAWHEKGERLDGCCAITGRVTRLEDMPTQGGLRMTVVSRVYAHNQLRMVFVCIHLMKGMVASVFHLDRRNHTDMTFNKSRELF